MNRMFSQETAILHLFRRHQALIQGGKAAYASGDERLADDLCDQATEIEAQLMDMPSTCAADFAAKLIVDTCQGSIFDDWSAGVLWQEARQLTGMALTA